MYTSDLGAACTSNPSRATKEWYIYSAAPSSSFSDPFASPLPPANVFALPRGSHGLCSRLSSPICEMWHSCVLWGLQLYSTSRSSSRTEHPVLR
jgi:hypothetical protein